MGVISGIDHRGAEWLKIVLDGHQDLQASLIIAVFGGCPTRRHDLEELLESQELPNDRARFRLLPMDSAAGLPENCIAVLPKKDAAWVLVVGPSPNFGLDGIDRTQVNFVFPIEPLLFDQWRSWFDFTWLRSAPLTKATADIPPLVPDVGTPEAAAQWNAYCARCTEQARDRGDADVSVDPETGEVQPQIKPGSTGRTTEPALIRS
jgi:hypothetical protein